MTFEHPFVMTLKLKYRRASKGRYKGGERPAKLKKRNKIGPVEHEKRHGKQPSMVMVVDKFGRSHMERL